MKWTKTNYKILYYYYFTHFCFVQYRRLQHPTQLLYWQSLIPPSLSFNHHPYPPTHTHSTHTPKHTQPHLLQNSIPKVTFQLRHVLCFRITRKIAYLPSFNHFRFHFSNYIVTPARPPPQTNLSPQHIYIFKKVHACILVQTSNRTLYKHEYNGV